MTPSVEDRLTDLELRVIALEGKASRAPPLRPAVDSRKKSPREFLLSKAPKSDNDKTLVAGYFIEIVEGRESFDFDDVEQFYAQAKEAAPANRRDPPYQNVKKGYFREVGKRQVGKTARNRWALTNSGIARVDGGFKKGGAR